MAGATGTKPIPIISSLPAFLNFISDLKEGEEREFEFFRPKKPKQLTEFTNAVREASAGRLIEIKPKPGNHKVYVVRISETKGQ